jgi:hypothetical protein
MLRRLLLLVCATALAAAATAAGASASPAHAQRPAQLHVTLQNTAVHPGGSQWTSADGVVHARGLPVTDDMVGDSGTLVGTISRHINFDLDPSTGSSRAWCDFTMSFVDGPVVSGRCGGSLNGGLFAGHGDRSAVVGRYALVAGGTPGVGPYALDMILVGRGTR